MKNAEQIKGELSGQWGQEILKHAPQLSEMVARGKKHGPCPLCGGKDRARCHDDFDETGGVICNQCKGGADGIATIMWANDWTFKETLNALGGGSVASSPMPKKKEKSYVLPTHKAGLSEKAYKYLVIERCIAPSVLEENKIGFSEASRSITFPFIKNGQVVNVQSRTHDKKFMLVKGAEIPLFGRDNISNDVTVWVEGQMDMMSIQTAGIKNVVSQPNGAKSFTFFESEEKRLSEVKEFIVWTDNDKDGKHCETEIARRLGYSRCKRVEPCGICVASGTKSPCKDANDVLVKHGADAVREMIADAVEFPVEGVVLAETLDLIGHYTHGNHDGISTGFNSVDRLFKFDSEMGELVIVHGMPSMGKSEFVDQLIVNTNRDSDWKWGVFSPENYPIEYHMEKFAEKSIGLPFKEGFQRRMQPDDVRASQAWMNENIYFVLPKKDDYQLDDICLILKDLVIRKGIRGAVIDPINEFPFPAGDGLSETQWITGQLTKLRKFARNHGLTIVLVCHPTKMKKTDDGGRYSGGYEPPSPYDIAGSSSFRSKADLIACVHRPKYGREDDDYSVEIHCQKVKKKYLGQTGMTTLQYCYSTGRYSE